MHKSSKISWATICFISWLFFLGFLPTMNLLWPLFFIVTLFLPFSWQFLLLIIPAKLLFPLLDPLVEPWGYWLLNLEILQPLFVSVANLPLLAFSGYNSSLVAASFLLLPLFFTLSWLLCFLLAEPLRNFYEKLAHNFIFSRVQSRENLPKALRRAFPEKKMQRWLQEIPANRKFDHLTFFSQQKGVYQLKDNLGKPQLRQLNRLYKTFQLKRLRRYSTLTLLLLLFATGVWVNGKKDAFLSNFLERYLGKLNGAQVDLEGLQLSLLQARLSFDKLALSNARKPEENRLQIGRTVVDIDNRELWLGRVSIAEISSRSLLLNQARIKAGTVYEKPLPVKKEQKSSSWGLTLQTKDVADLIEEEWANLASQKLLAELVAEYEARAKVWVNKKEDYQERADALISKVGQQLQKTPSLTSLQALNSQINDNKALWQEIQNLVRRGRNDLSAIAAEKEASERSWNLLQDQITADATVLSKKLTEFSDLERLSSLFTNFLEEELRARIANPNLIKAYDFIQAQRNKTGQKAEPKKKRFNRKVDFLSDRKPLLYIDTIYLDGGEQQPFYLQARHLSSQPQLVSEPMQFSWGQELENARYQGIAEIDLRTDKIKATLNADFLNFPFRLESELPPLHYQGLQSSSLTLDLSPDGWVSLNYEGLFKPLGLQSATRSINDIPNAILNADTLKFQTKMRTNFQQFEFLSLESNLEELIKRVFIDRAEQFSRGLEREVFSKLEQRLQEQWSEELLLPFQDNLEQLSASFTDITDTLASEVNLLDNDNNALETTVADLSKKINEELAENLKNPVQEVEKEAKKLGEDLSKQLPKSNPLKKLF